MQEVILQVSIKYTILQGDTIHSISQNVLGSTDFWIDIVELNGLNYPFIMDSIPEEYTGNIRVPGGIIVKSFSTTDMVDDVILPP